jgi:hypothetical protein
LAHQGVGSRRAPARPDGDSHVDPLIEARQDRHEAIDGKATELRLPYA